MGIDTRQFHIDKEIYAKYFEEYFQISRDRFSGHLQDIDFVERIELWNDIEFQKIVFFVDTSHLIYVDILGSLHIQGFQIYTDLPSYGALSALANSLPNITFIPSVTTVAQHFLGMVSPNSLVVLNDHPIHRRAGQLNTIARWINFQLTLYPKLKDYPDCIRILKAQLLTDAVSYADCLVTRIATGPHHVAEGLEDLILNEQPGDSPLSDFKNAFKFDEILSLFRRIRNRFGGHLDDDDVTPLSILKAEIDSVCIGDIIQFFLRCHSMFQKICNNVPLLSGYRIDGEIVRSIISTTTTNGIVPFDGKDHLFIKLLPESPEYSQKRIKEHLEAWQLNPNVKSPQRDFFYDAFRTSTAVKTVYQKTLKEGMIACELGDVYRIAHQIVEDSLLAAPSLKSARVILSLIDSCSNGFPLPLAHIVVNAIHRGLRNDALPHALFTLGKLCYWDWEFTQQAILFSSTSANLMPRLLSKVALFNIFVKSEGLSRVNNKRSLIDYDKEIFPLLQETNKFDAAFLHIIIASQFLHGTTSFFIKELANIYEQLQHETKELIEDFLAGQATPNAINNIFSLVNHHDYVGICLLIGDLIKDSNSHFSFLLYNAAAQGFVLYSNDSYSHRHLAICHLRVGDRDAALLIMQTVAASHPDLAFMQLSFAHVLVDSGELTKARNVLNNIEKQYCFSSEEQELLTMLKEKLAQENT